MTQKLEKKLRGRYKKGKIKISNPSLQERRVRLIGDENFVPKSYLHLAHHWRILSNNDFQKGEEYGMLRGLALKSQNRKVNWTHKSQLELCTSWDLTPNQMRDIERTWGKVVRKLTLEEIGLMDWLVHAPITYECMRDNLRKMMLKTCCIFKKL